MATSLVTGVAGFIGFHLANKLLEIGHRVIGIDSFSDYYSPQLKRDNVKHLKSSSFGLRETDLSVMPGNVLDDVDYVFHLAARPGVRNSWGDDFSQYVRDNIAATQILLEHLKTRTIKKLIFASSSSVYGNYVDRRALDEECIPMPFSPYGVTKLASEQLCLAYGKNFGIPTVALRFFTVFGPRQRPDMAFHRLISAAISDNEFEVYGDGSQERDFTFVDDIVSGCLAAAESNVSNEIINLGGGNILSLNQAIKHVSELVRKRIAVKFLGAQRGDVIRTEANIEKAKRLLGYEPKVGILEGLERQISFQAAATYGKTYNSVRIPAR